MKMMRNYFSQKRKGKRNFVHKPNYDYPEFAIRNPFPMSQLLFRLSKSKLLPQNNSLMHKKSIRLFSSSCTSPYLTLCCIEKASGSNIGDILLFDAAKEELVTVRDKTVPKELGNANVIGASHGWGLFRQDQYSLHISDLFNPLASKSTPASIPLPPFTPLISCQTDIVWNMAMSSSPRDDDADWVVGIKFLGNQLSLCRPRRDLRWTSIPTPFDSFQNSNLVFSKRDQTFLLPTPGGNYLCSWDLHFHKDNYPKFHELLFHNVPEWTQSDWELLDSCPREDHWVESPSGESFLVKWYSCTCERSTVPILMVFREEDTKEGKRRMCYTEDIGDLCIFLSKSEAFCVQASSCPGLKRNSVYFMGRGFAVYDLATKIPRPFEHPKGAPEEIPLLPYWLPPFSMLV